MRGEDPYSGIPQPEGPYYPQPQQQQPQATPEPPAFFDAGDLWKVGYRFPAQGVEGSVPQPSQAKIDRYERERAKVLVRLEIVERRALEAQGRLNQVLDQNLEQYEAEAYQEVEKALEQKSKVISQFKDIVAELCSNKPTRKQLEKEPENVFFAFHNYLREHLNPNF